MCEKSKDKEEADRSKEKPAEKSYYYDDAHGYEDFDPSEDDEAPDEDELA